MSRSFITVNTVRRMYLYIKDCEAEKRLDSLNDLAQSERKELRPYFKLISVKFDSETRITKLEFCQIHYYRTIDRYVTRNYVRYPIYSSWKVKSKNIKKSIKLTNAELEKLNQNEDELIRDFADYIIAELPSDDFYPSWFLSDTYNKYCELRIKAHKDELNGVAKDVKEQIDDYDELIEKREEERTNLLRLSLKIEKKSGKLNNKIIKTKNAKRSLFLSVISFGIYAYYISASRLERLNNTLLRCQNDLFDIKERIDKLEADNRKDNENINAALKTYEDKKNEIEARIKKEQNKLDNMLSHIDSLTDEYREDDEFILLKEFAGFSYKNIIGCYVIHNKENDKYYVGQSKDVMKRLRQHFRGTVPNNVIFAEDYFSSDYENKEDLFEVKIIPCETKDELDRMERELIEKYDSRNYGYNRTIGNS